MRTRSLESRFPFGYGAGEIALLVGDIAQQFVGLGVAFLEAEDFIGGSPGIVEFALAKVDDPEKKVKFRLPGQVFDGLLEVLGGSFKVAGAIPLLSQRVEGGRQIADGHGGRRILVQSTLEKRQGFLEASRVVEFRSPLESVGATDGGGWGGMEEEESTGEDI